MGICSRIVGYVVRFFWQRRRSFATLMDENPPHYAVKSPDNLWSLQNEACMFWPIQHDDSKITGGSDGIVYRISNWQIRAQQKTLDDS